MCVYLYVCREICVFVERYLYQSIHYFFSKCMYVYTYIYINK